MQPCLLLFPLLSQSASLCPGLSLCFNGISSYNLARGLGPTPPALGMDPAQTVAFSLSRGYYFGIWIASPTNQPPGTISKYQVLALLWGLVEGLLSPKRRSWSLPLHFALKPTPSGSEKEGEEA